MSMILSAMNERTAASNTAMHKFVASAISPLQDDIKALYSQAAASENRLESWTEKLAHGLDLQGKRTFELGCDVKKMGDRMAAMERAAGIAPPCQSAHVDLTEDVNTVPRIHSLKRSAETAELETATEQRLARVEDALIQIVAHLKTPRSSPSSSPSSSFSSSDPSSFIPQQSLFTSSPNFYGHLPAPENERIAAILTTYFQQEDSDELKQTRRNSVLSRLRFPSLK